MDDSISHKADEVDWSRLRLVVITLMSIGLLALVGYNFVNLGQSVDVSGAPTTAPFTNSTEIAPGNERTSPPPNASGIVYETLPSPLLAGQPSLPPPYLPSLRQGEKRHTFEWTSTPRPKPRPTLFVSGRNEGRGHFHSLDSAVSHLEDAGGWIQLDGPGPFSLTATTLVDCGHVRISTPNNSTRAVVVLLPGTKPGSSALQLHNTHLELERIDFTLPASGFPNQRRLTLFSADSSDLRLADCSITQHRDREGGTVAISISGSVDGRACRVVLDKVLSRGRNTTSLAVDSRSADIAVFNSLLVSDTASPLRLRTPRPSTSETDGRRIRLFSSTLFSQAPLLTLDSGDMDTDIASTDLRLVNTLMASPADGDGILMDLGRWPQRADNQPGTSRFIGLEWHQHASLSFGVRRFILRAPDSGLSVDSYPDWQSCWSGPGEKDAFVAAPWRPLKVAAHTVSPSYFDTRRFGTELQIGTDGNPPGCQVFALHQRPPSDRGRADALTQRPRWPHPRPTPRPVLSLKLSDHPDLGRFLADNPPPPNAVIIVEGAGRTVTSPIVVASGGLRLVFKDTIEEQPLILVPDSPPPATTSPNLAPNAPPTRSMFIVNGGTLELVGGRFQLPEQGGPAWFLHVDDGEFAIRNCSLLGPRGGASDAGGLININGSKEKGSGRILDSFLAGGGSLVRTQHPNRSLLVTDSLLFSTGKVFDLDLSPTLRSCIDIRRSTLSGGDSIFHIRTTESGASQSRTSDHCRLDLFIDETAFAAGIAPANAGEPQGAIISFRGRKLDAGRLRWWGTHNGFSPTRRHYLVDRDGQMTNQQWGTARHFASVFPSPHRIRPLDGPGGIPLATPLPKATQVRPTHFRIAAKGLGLKWGSGGRPIGADLDKLDSQLGAVGPPRTPPTRTRPDF